MTQGNTLIKNTLIIALGKIFTQFLTFLLLPLYTALLSPAVYGQFDLIIVYMGLLAPVLTLQTEMAVFRHLIDSRDDKSSQGVIISSALAVTIAGLLFGVFAIVIVGGVLNIPLLWFIVGTFTTTVLLNFFLQVARGIGRNDLFAAGSIVVGLINIGLSVLALVVLNMSIDGLLVALMIANVAGTIFLALKTGSVRMVKASLVDKHTIQQLVGYSWPLVPNHASLWGLNGVGRTVIALVLGMAAAGIFAAASKFTLIYSSLYGIFAMSWTESVSLHIKKKNNFLSNVTNSTVRMFASLALLIISASAILFPFLVANDFNEAKKYIPLLLIGGFMASLVAHYGAIYLAVKKTKKLAVVTLQALIISTILTLVGVYLIGLYAPAAAVIVTYLYIAVRRHYDVQKYVEIRYSPGSLATLSIIATLVLMCYYIDNEVLNIVSFVVLASVLTFINRLDLHKIKNTLLRKGNF